MPPQGASYNVDWVVSTSSDVHVATDRAWFTSYTPYRTKIRPMPGAKPSVEIHGIGTVALHTRTYREGKSHKPSGQLILRHVLHAPNSPANIFAMSREPNLTIPFNGDVEPIVKRGSRKVIGLVICSKLMRLWLRGQSKNHSSLNPDRLYYIHASWPKEEMSKYNKFVEEAKSMRASQACQEPPLTDTENELMKKTFGDEFKFLLFVGLSIYKEEDRAEGRRVIRVLNSFRQEMADLGFDEYRDLQTQRRIPC